MRDKIINYLSVLEKERNIKILLACETGSRAWGFPSPDSDFDVRLIYVHEKNWYLGLIDKKDSLDVMLENNDLDFSGWDLRKCLRLLMKSNASLIERIQSPIIYKADETFLAEMLGVANDFYSRIATIHHYLNLAKNCLFEVEGKEEYKLKKFFYALRAATACKWIVEKDALPPIEFQKTLDGLEIDASIKNRIAELIALKATISEAYLHKGDEDVINFIKENIALAELNRTELPAAKGKVEDLNKFFIKNLQD